MLLGLALGLTAAPVQAKEACAKKPCTLAEVLALVTAQHPLVQAARAGEAAYEAKLLASKLTWLPTVKSKGLVSVTPRKFGDPLEGGTDYELENWRPIVRIEVSGTLPIYTFGKLSTLRAMAREGIQVGQARTEAARTEVQLLAAKAWYSLQFAREVTDLLGDGQKYLDRARNYLEKLRDEDSEEYDDVDMLRLRIYESQVGSMRLDARRTRELARSGLVTLTGLSADHFGAGDKLVPLDYALQPLPTYVNLAYGHRGELLALEAAMRAQGLQVSLEKRNFLPNFFLGAYFTLSKAWAVEPQGSPFAFDPYNSWFGGGGLGLEWTLDPARRILALDEARAGARKLRAQHKALRQKVAMEVEQSWREAQDLQQKLALARTAHKAARGWMIAELDLYESGLEPFKEIADALTAYFRERIQYEQVKLEHNLAIAKLAGQCGVSLEGFVGEAAGGRPEAGGEEDEDPGGETD